MVNKVPQVSAERLVITAVALLWPLLRPCPHCRSMATIWSRPFTRANSEALVAR